MVGEQVGFEQAALHEGDGVSTFGCWVGSRWSGLEKETIPCPLLDRNGALQLGGFKGDPLVTGVELR